MKSYFNLAIVLVATTGLSIGFRQAMSGTSEASRQEPSSDRLERAAGLDQPGLTDSTRRPIEGAALAPVDTGSGDDRADKEFARVSAAMGDRLFDRARQEPDNSHLLRQAAAHYRAALAHEPTARDAGDLFVAVRDRLTNLDREIARLDRPGITKLTPKQTVPPALVKASAPVATPEIPKPRLAPPVLAKPEPIMVGPDGVEIRRLSPRE